MSHLHRGRRLRLWRERRAAEAAGGTPEEVRGAGDAVIDRVPPVAQKQPKASRVRAKKVKARGKKKAA